MSKVFIQNGTGSTATLANAHNEKIPVYDTLQDAEADLTDLEENQIVATQDNGNNNRFVTQSEYKVDNTYSTTETDTGKTWIDGKKIYRRVLEVSVSFTSGTWAYVSYSNDIESLLYVGLIHKFPNDTSKFTICNPTSTSFNANQVSFLVANSSSASKIILEYTKTGD